MYSCSGAASSFLPSLNFKSWFSTSGIW
jgi:hypothetical protein